MKTDGHLHLHLDPHSGVPVYRQMMDQIKYYIASGTLEAGDQLPSIRELAQTLTINPTTVVKAFTGLVNEQLIELRHGKGAFVIANNLSLSSTEREKPLRRLARQVAVEAVQLGVPSPRVLQLVEQEMLELRRERAEVEMPVRYKVVGSRG